MIWISAAVVFAAVSLGTASEEIPLNGSARIVGGIETNFKQQPYVVRVVYRVYHYIGVATLIAPRMALTAAQVTYKLKASDICIKVNDKSRRDSRERSRESHGRDSREKDDSLFEVLKIIEHTCYDPLTQDNDIAILKLLDPIRLKIYPQLPKFFEDPVVSTVVAISGWGVRENLKAEYSDKLETVVVEVSDFDVCRAFYR